ncbi:RNA polymerase sigma factor [Fredinandcohnia humi]
MDWESIWRQHWQEIYMYVYHRVRHKQEAEDVTQEAFIRAIKADERYASIEVNIVALLKTIAKNVIIDKARKHKNASPQPFVGELIDEHIPIEKEIEQKDEVERALSLLNDEQRKIVTYRLLKGLSIKETAALLGRNETYVKVVQFRAIHLIRNLLIGG